MAARIEALLPFWWAFVLLGVVEIAGGIASARHESNRGKFGPVLKDASAIAVSSAGEIFVYANYAEIRVYELDGRLSRTWPVETLQGGASIEFNSDERLEVFAWRGNRLFVFNVDGQLLRSRTLSPSEANPRIVSTLTRQATSPSGDSYELRESEIVRSSPTGTSTVVVPGPPSYLRFFLEFPGGPFVFHVHGATVVLFGIVLAHFGRSKTVAQRPNKQPQPTTRAPQANGEREPARSSPRG